MYPTILFQQVQLDQYEHYCVEGSVLSYPHREDGQFRCLFDFFNFILFIVIEFKKFTNDVGHQPWEVGLFGMFS